MQLYSIKEIGAIFSFVVHIEIYQPTCDHDINTDAYIIFRYVLEVLTKSRLDGILDIPVKRIVGCEYDIDSVCKKYHNMYISGSTILRMRLMPLQNQLNHNDYR